MILFIPRLTIWMKKSDLKPSEPNFVNRFNSNPFLLGLFNKHIENWHNDAKEQHEFFADFWKTNDDASLRKRHEILCQYFEDAVCEQRKIEDCLHMLIQFQSSFATICNKLETFNVHRLTRFEEISNLDLSPEKMLPCAFKNRGVAKSGDISTLIHAVDIERELNQLIQLIRDVCLIHSNLRKCDQLRGVAWKCTSETPVAINTMKEKYRNVHTDFFSCDPIAELFFIADNDTPYKCASLSMHRQIAYNLQMVKDRVLADIEAARKVEEMVSRLMPKYLAYNTPALVVEQRRDIDDDGNILSTWIFIDSHLIFDANVFCGQKKFIPDYVQHACSLSAFACRMPTPQVRKWIWSYTTTCDAWYHTIQRKSGLTMRIEEGCGVTEIKTIFDRDDQFKCGIEEAQMRLAYEMAIARALFVVALKPDSCECK